MRAVSGRSPGGLRACCPGKGLRSRAAGEPNSVAVDLARQLNEWARATTSRLPEYGFGYLDAVRKGFSSAPETHTDLIPRPWPRPYDKVYRRQQREEEQIACRSASLQAGAPRRLIVVA